MTLWYQRVSGALHRRVGREAVVASADHDGFGMLSETAEEVWRRLDEPRTDTELLEGLAADYGEPVERIGPQVRALMDEMAHLGWVQVLSDGDD